MDRSQYAEARAAFERAVRADPLMFKAHYQLSLACARLGDEAAAGQYLERYRQTIRGVQKMIDELRMATGTTPFEPRLMLFGKVPGLISI